VSALTAPQWQPSRTFAQIAVMLRDLVVHGAFSASVIKISIALLQKP